jgi:hypothetical protein
MDKASQALTESLPDGIPDTPTARGAYSKLPLSTLTRCANGRPSKEAKAIGQRYLHPYEADAVCGTTDLVGEDAMPLYAMLSLR